MFHRNILSSLDEWLHSDKRKPLVIRGARQVGKTTAVNQFAQRFEQYIYLNLELLEDRQLFEQFSDWDSLLGGIFFLKDKSLSKKENTLIFIDEIQASPKAVNVLRYFYEQEPRIAVIAAGSALENLFSKNVNFPVGRVEYKVLRPVSFPEFLGAMGEENALEQLLKIPMADFAHQKLLKLFHIYALIGGMPEIVEHYSKHKDFTALAPLYDSLIASYMDDAEKYATSATQLQMIRHAIRSVFAYAGKRIKYQGFGNSNYASREMGEALRTLEKTLLISIVHPDTSYTLPLLPDLKKSPRLHILDTGLVNYYVGLQKDIIGTADLGSIYQGFIIEHLVGQELLATQFGALSGLHFWVREKNGALAEVDYLYPYEGKLIPIEVKSGATGTLKSLHLFMEHAPHNFAVRFYAGPLDKSLITTPEGKEFHLLSLPYFLASQVEGYLGYYFRN